MKDITCTAQFIYFTVCKTTDENKTVDSGLVYEVPNQNTECVFPFIFENKEYKTCTNYKCPECFWCGTQYTGNDTSGWGLCNEACPKETYGKYLRMSK